MLVTSSKSISEATGGSQGRVIKDSLHCMTTWLVINCYCVSTRVLKFKCLLSPIHGAEVSSINAEHKSRFEIHFDIIISSFSYVIIVIIIITIIIKA